MYPKLKINVYFIFLNIRDLTFGITLVFWIMTSYGLVAWAQIEGTGKQQASGKF
jgi:hypothetical protein